MSVISDLNNWTEVSQGFYRFIIAAKVCYELHIQYRDLSKDIKTAIANLYIVGQWKDNVTGGLTFERELLVERESVEQCLTAAAVDNEENNS